jgi:hypothetical protein
VLSGLVTSGDSFVARIQVDRIWKGPERSEIVMRTGAESLGNGMMRMSSCDANYAVGQRYIVYARGTDEKLIAGGCDRTGPVNDADMKELDAIVPPKRIGSEIRRCAAGESTASGEIRLAIATSAAAPATNVRTTADGLGRRYAAITDDAGRAVFSGLQPGAYTITVDRDGYGAKQLAITLPAASCMHAAMFLSPATAQ